MNLKMILKLAFLENTLKKVKIKTPYCVFIGLVCIVVARAGVDLPFFPLLDGEGHPGATHPPAGAGEGE